VREENQQVSLAPGRRDALQEGLVLLSPPFPLPFQCIRAPSIPGGTNTQHPISSKDYPSRLFPSSSHSFPSPFFHAAVASSIRRAPKFPAMCVVVLAQRSVAELELATHGLPDLPSECSLKTPFRIRTDECGIHMPRK